MENLVKIEGLRPIPFHLWVRLLLVVAHRRHRNLDFLLYFYPRFVFCIRFVFDLCFVLYSETSVKRVISGSLSNGMKGTFCFYFRYLSKLLYLKTSETVVNQ